MPTQGVANMNTDWKNPASEREHSGRHHLHGIASQSLPSIKSVSSEQLHRTFTKSQLVGVQKADFTICRNPTNGNLAVSLISGPGWVAVNSNIDQCSN